SSPSARMSEGFFLRAALRLSARYLPIRPLDESDIAYALETHQSSGSRCARQGYQGSHCGGPHRSFCGHQSWPLHRPHRPSLLPRPAVSPLPTAPHTGAHRPLVPPAFQRARFPLWLFSPFESPPLPDLNSGTTNQVNPATARADELANEELRAGGKRLEAKV